MKKSPRKSPRKSRSKDRAKNPLEETFLEDQYDLYHKRKSWPLPDSREEVKRNSLPGKKLPDIPVVSKAKEEKTKELSQALVTESFPVFFIKDMRNKFFNIIKERKFLSNIDEKKLNQIKMTIDSLEENILKLNKDAQDAKTNDDFLNILRSIKNFKTFANRIDRNIIDMSYEMDCENRFKSVGKCEDIGACERQGKTCKRVSNEKRERNLLKYYMAKN